MLEVIKFLENVFVQSYIYKRSTKYGGFLIKEFGSYFLSLLILVSA